MSRLENKIAVITGANSGIGLATAKCFIETGATGIYITDRRLLRMARQAEVAVHMDDWLSSPGLQWPN